MPTENTSKLLVRAKCHVAFDKVVSITLCLFSSMYAKSRYWLEAYGGCISCECRLLFSLAFKAYFLVFVEALSYYSQFWCCVRKICRKFLRAYFYSAKYCKVCQNIWNILADATTTGTNRPIGSNASPIIFFWTLFQCHWNELTTFLTTSFTAIWPKLTAFCFGNFSFPTQPSTEFCMSSSQALSKVWQSFFLSFLIFSHAISNHFVWNSLTYHTFLSIFFYGFVHMSSLPMLPSTNQLTNECSPRRTKIHAKFSTYPTYTNVVHTQQQTRDIVGPNVYANANRNAVNRPTINVGSFP